MGLLLRQRRIAPVQRGVPLVVDGVVRLVSGLPRGAVLPGNDRLGLRSIGKVLMLDHTGIGRLRIGIVHHGVALIIVGVQYLRLKPEAAILQRTQPIVKIGVNGAGIDHSFRQRRQLPPLPKEIRVQPYLDPLQHPLHHSRVAVLGDALIPGVEVVVVIGEAYRQPPDDKGGQLRAGTAPLLLGVPLHQLFVNIPPH